MSSLRSASTAAPRVRRPPPPPQVKALCFDVFGTVVDWRTSLSRECRLIGERVGVDGVDWDKFADEYRGIYQPLMSLVREGKICWRSLDELHAMGLPDMLEKMGIADKFSEADRRDLVMAYHRLDAWPDSSNGLRRLASRFSVNTLSNGNRALMEDLAERNNLPWTNILGGDVVKAYKPTPEAYLKSIERLGLQPEECMMVAAHSRDLKMAASFGMRTAYIIRPTELGSSPERRARTARDLQRAQEQRSDVIAKDFNDFADQMGCMSRL